MRSSRSKGSFFSLILLFIIPLLFGLFYFKKIPLDFSFFSFGKEEMANPIPDLTEKERLSNLLDMASFKVEQINVLDSSFEASLSGKLTVFFTKDEDLASQVASLQLIVGRSKIEGRIPTFVDLRFEKPVLKY